MKKIFAYSIALAALVACNKQSNEPAVNTGMPIRFSVSGEYVFTKATESALENNDEVQIIAGAPVNKATKATVNGTALSLTTQLYWAPGQTDPTNFVAIYPYTESTSTSVAYDLFLNNVHSFDYHKMYITAKVASAPTDESLILNFKHPFSKVLINITNNLGSDVVESVVVKGVKMSGTLDLVAETIDLGEAENKDVPATEIAPNSYGLIVMPQSALPTIVITTHLGSVYTFALPSAFNFEAGKVATASITLEGQGGGGETQGDPISFGFNVTNWSAVETEPDFGQNTVVMGSYWYVLGCVYTDDNTVAAWGKDFPMTYKGTDNENKEIWEATVNYDEAMAGEFDVNRGFKLRKYAENDENKWANQLGMWSTDGNDFMNIEYGYDLASSTDGNKNVRFEEAGNYKLTLTGNRLTVVKND